MECSKIYLSGEFPCDGLFPSGGQCFTNNLLNVMVNNLTAWR